ncbi:TPA: 50S ribosomal protein L1 [archaeon]|nr:50S ribosomal protein L1 [Candidatus Naiadarchaeales archaeon SRR2090153.bin1042]
MKPEEILQAVMKVRELAAANPRKFKQTFDLQVTLQELDMKKPESKVKLEVVLPHGKGKPVRYGAVAEGEFAEKAKNAGLKIIVGRADLQNLAKDKKAARKIIREVDIFVAQPDLMVEVGKTLGATLGPRDKMPKPVNPKDDLKNIFARFDKMITARVKDQPIIHCAVGVEQMTDQQIVENVEKILTSLKEKLPKGESQIKSAHLKLTMSPSVKIGAVEKAAGVKA